MVNTFLTLLELLSKVKGIEQVLQMMKEQENKTYGSQFKSAIMLAPQVTEDGEIDEVTGLEAFLHFASVGWKLLFSLVPPARYGGGWYSFSISLAFIGIVTAIVGEFATLFGCVIGLKPAVTAISFVALGNLFFNI
jgi:hypothetical protein